MALYIEDQVGDARDSQATPVERLLNRRRVPEDEHIQLSDRARQYQRTLEGYLQAGNRPRWMERLGEIEAGKATNRRRLEREYRRLRTAHAGDPDTFARTWREVAAMWEFGEVNLRIQQHNEWFPIERRLAVDPRTGDYVKINGRSYRREPLDADWILSQFPAEL